MGQYGHIDPMSSITILFLMVFIQHRFVSLSSLQKKQKQASINLGLYPDGYATICGSLDAHLDPSS